MGVYAPAPPPRENGEDNHWVQSLFEENVQDLVPASFSPYQPLYMLVKPTCNGLGAARRDKQTGWTTSTSDLSRRYITRISSFAKRMSRFPRLILVHRGGNTPCCLGVLQSNSTEACWQMGSTAASQDEGVIFLSSANQDIHDKGHTISLKSFTNAMPFLILHKIFGATILPSNTLVAPWFICTASWRHQHVRWGEIATVLRC